MASKDGVVQAGELASFPAKRRHSLASLYRRRRRRRPHLTLLARCIALMGGEVLANALVWIIAAIVFRHRGGGAASEGDQGQATSGNKVLGLALIAWTTGLRHGLDADHISAIDNATRRIVSVPQHIVYADGRAVLRRRRPVTVGLFFSLGHSTVVFATIVAIAVSVGIADRLDVYGDVGGIIGASISGSFLFLIGCINSVILYKTWRRLQEGKRKADREASGQLQQEEHDEAGKKKSRHFNGILTRLAMPLLKSVDRPWKMYPVGLLFGLGFDTASSIALLSVAVIGLQTGSDNNSSSSNANVVLLALLFTAGMTIVDSADSCLMIFAYAPESKGRHGRRRFALIERQQEADDVAIVPSTPQDGKQSIIENPTSYEISEQDEKDNGGDAVATSVPVAEEANSTHHAALPSLDASASCMSLVLTLLSILVAFAISLVVLMGLIGEQCSSCSAAADRQESHGDGGLAGRWWLAWQRANDNSGYIGAGVVGAFALCVIVFFTTRRLLSWYRARPAGRQDGAEADATSEDIAACVQDATPPLRPGQERSGEDKIEHAA